MTSEEMEPDPPDPPDPDAPVRVLVVDDEAEVRRLLKLGLERAGFVVDLAVDGDDALRRVTDQRPDVVVCDMLMPARRGTDVLAGLGELYPDDAPPVIVLTVLQDHATISDALRAGAVDVIGKPFAPSEVVERVIAAWRRFGAVRGDALDR